MNVSYFIQLIFKLIANQLKSPIVFADEDNPKTFKTDLLGDYQNQNIRGVVTTLKQLKEFEVTQDDIKKGLANVVANTRLLGRWQVLEEEPKTISDTAHNKEGLQLVLKQISKEKYNDAHFVLGFVNDKELEDVLPLFPKEAKYYFVKPNVPRGLNAEKLRVKAMEFELIGSAYSTVKKGLKAAKKHAKDKDLIYVGGSTFVVAEVV